MKNNIKTQNTSSKQGMLINMKQRLNQNAGYEWLGFGLFVMLYILVSLFHEPMYDEAQAWLIARDASWKELIFTIPHYEGHPPFWHLILALFAKTGMPFELGLRIPGALFCITSVWLIIFRSPFPKVVRCLLPFTYYIFYRYSIVVRPYCMTMLGFCLVAMAYKRRKEKPFYLMAALLLLCMSSAYGMAFAAGICIVWLIELFTVIKKDYLKHLAALAILLIFNVAQLLLMLPMDDTNSVVSFEVSTIIYGLVYMCVLGPADAMFLDTGMDARLQNYAEGIVTGGIASYVNLFAGFITVAVLIYFARKYKKLLLLCIPYTLFAVFSAAVYFWYHHIGLIHLFLIFLFWCALQDNEKRNDIKIPSFVKGFLDKNIRLCKPIPKLALTLCLGMSIAWSVFCAGTDLTKATWYTEDLAEGIREVGADNGSCALQWDISGIGPFENPEDYTDASKYYHTPSITQFFDCLAYFDENIFYNHNGGDPDISYNRQILTDAEGQALIMEENAAHGYPEYVIGLSFVLDALPIEEEMPVYYPVYRFEVYKPDKFIIDYNDRYIYAREDVYLQRTDWPIKEQLTVK